MNYDEVERAVQTFIKRIAKIAEVSEDDTFRSLKKVYLRTDILNELGKRDAESARWDDYCLPINWAIVNRNDWENPKLLRMIDKRISTSFGDENVRFADIFNSEAIDLRSPAGKLHGLG